MQVLLKFLFFKQTLDMCFDEILNWSTFWFRLNQEQSATTMF